MVVYRIEILLFLNGLRAVTTALALRLPFLFCSDINDGERRRWDGATIGASLNVTTIEYIDEQKA